MRQCPTLEGESRPLIAHRIEAGSCLARQRELYHKCHRCVYRGKPAAYVHPSDSGAAEAEQEAAAARAPASAPDRAAPAPVLVPAAHG